MPDTVKTHITMTRAMKEALTTLAELEGTTLSDLLERIAREELKQRGYEPKVTGRELAAELERRKKSGRASV